MERPFKNVCEAYNYPLEVRQATKMIREAIETSVHQKNEIKRFDFVEIEPNVCRPMLFGEGAFGDQAVQYVRFPSYYVETTNIPENLIVVQVKGAHKYPAFWKHRGPPFGDMAISSNGGEMIGSLYCYKD